jgi:hypothetical protein
MTEELGPLFVTPALEQAEYVLEWSSAEHDAEVVRAWSDGAAE